MNNLLSYCGLVVDAKIRASDKDLPVPLIAGNAFVTGFNTIVVDRKDPFQNGFTVGDIWT